MVYNGLIRSRNRVDEAWSDIEVQLKGAMTLSPIWWKRSKAMLSKNPLCLRMITDAQLSYERWQYAGKIKR